MSYTDLRTTFVYKILFTFQLADQLAENDAMMIQKTGGAAAVITPAAAVVGLTIDQNENEKALVVDSESVDNNAVTVNGKRCLVLTQDLNDGYGLIVSRNRAGVAGSFPLVRFTETAAANTQPVVEIQNAGSGNDIITPNFTLKNGYIAPGGLEAMRWDVVEINIDQASPESVAYALDGLKCKAMSAIGYDVNTDDIHAISDTGNAFYTAASHNGANLDVNYGNNYVNDDDLRVIIFTTA